MRSIKELIDFESLSENIGKSFLIGYASGIFSGSLIGQAESINDLPLISLNTTLNRASSYGLQFAYNFGAISGIHTLSKQLTSKLNPITSCSISGGAVGTFIGSKWGWKGATSGCIFGAAIGASYGYYSENKNLLSLI